MKKQIKCWAEELYEEFNFYDYKGAFVIAKTEKEKKEIANKHKSLSDQRLKEAKKRGLIVVPEDFFLITSDTEESVDAEIKRNEEVGFLDRKELKHQSIPLLSHHLMLEKVLENNRVLF